MRYFFIAYISDIDMIPNTGLDQDLELFLRRNLIPDNTALVFPLFEIKTGVPLPRDKAQLTRLIHQEKARVFQIKVSKFNQESSNITR